MEGEKLPGKHEMGGNQGRGLGGLREQRGYTKAPRQHNRKGERVFDAQSRYFGKYDGTTRLLAAFISKHDVLHFV